MKSNLVILAVIVVGLLFSILAFSKNAQAIKLFHSDGAHVSRLEHFAKDVESGIYTNSQAAHKIQLLADAEGKIVSGAKKLELANYIFMAVFSLISLFQFIMFKKMKNS